MPDSEPKKSIYNEYGQIADQDQAHVVADKEKVARDLEIALETEAQTGLTPEEQVRLQIIQKIQAKDENDPILAKDSDGRSLHLDSEGRPYLILETPNVNPEGKLLTRSLFLLTTGGLSKVSQIGSNKQPEAQYLEESVWGSVASSVRTSTSNGMDTSYSRFDSLNRHHDVVVRPRNNLSDSGGALELKALIETAVYYTNLSHTTATTTISSAVPSGTSIADIF